MTQWGFNPILNSYFAVAILAVGMALLLLVRPTYGQLKPKRRWILIGMRLGVILLLTTAMLRPSKISMTNERQSAVLLVLFDQSRSMQLPSSAATQSRWQAQKSALQRIEADLSDIAEELDVKVYGYDHELHAVDFAQGRIAFPDVPQGDQTDLGSTLFEAVQRELGKRLIGIVVLGDGTQTAYAPQVEVQQAAREVARLDYPTYTVVFGPIGDSTESRDVVVENLPEQYTVFVKNELAVKGAMRVRGFVNKRIPVELEIEDASGNRRTIGPIQLAAQEDGQQVPIKMKFVPELPGQYKLTLRAAEQPGELVTRNNQLSAFVTVLEGGLRVLYLYGDLVGEQRLLRRSINASPDIQLDDRFIDPRNRNRWPISLAELREPEYDVLLIENVDASAFAKDNLDAIEKAVDSGKGLMMIGGYSSFGPGGYYQTPLLDVLPVTMGRFERQEVGFDQPISRDLHLWGDITMLPTDRPHPVTQLAAGAKNIQVWRSLPPLNGANKFGVKPTAQRLAETADRVPILVAGEYGNGRVLAFAANSTRLWWQFGRKSEHRRFWRQAILWLASREDLGKNDVWVKLGQRRFNPGAQVNVSAGAKTASGEVIRDATFEAEVVGEDGTRKTIRLTEDEDEFTGIADEITQPGDYLVQLRVSRNGELLGTARTNFQVLDRDVELSNPSADYETMTRLAEQTSSAGGRALAPEQLPSLMKELQDRRDELEIEVQTKWQLGDTALDAWAFVLALVGVLSAEWVLRKKWGMA